VIYYIFDRMIERVERRLRKEVGYENEK